MVSVPGMVAAGAPTVPFRFAVGGQIDGLAGTGLVLQLNDANDLAVMSNGNFAFPSVLSGTSYVVKVKEGAQPTAPAQKCTVANERGRVGGEPIANIRVTCATETFSVSGTVIGLLGSPLVLQNNLGDDLTIAGNGTFTFATEVASGGSYSVTVRAGSSPSNPTQACSITNGTGTIGSEDVDNVVVSCSTANFYISGTVNNLLGTGLQLINNEAETLTVGSPSFRFPSAVPSGSMYSVRVQTQPTAPKQLCTVANGAGTVGASDTAITVDCVTQGFTINVVVTGLQGSGLVLQNNLADDLHIASNGRFAFPTPLLTGTPYNVTVAGQPVDPNPAHFCYIASTNSAGIIGNADVDAVAINCL
jgi:trimeric autotransporter adhesin